MSNKFTLITGASSGIGKALARVMAAKKHDLVLVARNQQAMQTLAQELQTQFDVQVHVMAKDLSAANAAQTLYDEINAAGLTIEILVNNAGFGYRDAFGFSAMQTNLELIQVNITALTQLTRLFLPDMLARQSGRIMNVGSTGSFAPTPSMAVYCASKAYVLSFTEALAEELRGTGVTATVLCPGATKTGFGDHADVNESFLFKVTAMSPEAVAQQAYRALMQGKRRIITGFVNKLLVLGTQLAPTGFVMRSSQRMMRTPKTTISK